MQKPARAADELGSLWDALEQGHKPPPPNSITVRDYMARFNVTQAAASARLASAVDAGMMETGKFFYEKTGRSVKFFWLAKGKSK